VLASVLASLPMLGLTIANHKEAASAHSVG
jgi:hypothetical protein